MGTRMGTVPVRGPSTSPVAPNNHRGRDWAGRASWTPITPDSHPLPHLSWWLLLPSHCSGQKSWGRGQPLFLSHPIVARDFSCLYGHNRSFCRAPCPLKLLFSLTSVTANGPLTGLWFHLGPPSPYSLCCGKRTLSQCKLDHSSA